MRAWSYTGASLASWLLPPLKISPAVFVQTGLLFRDAHGTELAPGITSHRARY